VHSRLYLSDGDYAHIICYGSGGYAYASAVCGVSPDWPEAWYGTGSQDELDTARDLLLCPNCVESLKVADT
jgi:hypothetical protein